MVSSVLVFGTMVEFAAVLVAKQRVDWNQNAKEKNSRIIAKKPETHGIVNQDNNLKLSNIFDKGILTKDIIPN